MSRNNLYPIFLKVNQLSVLIVGGGAVGLEKLSFMLKSSPNAKVEVVAKSFCEELLALAEGYDVKLKKEPYRNEHLEGKQLVIGATDDFEVNKSIHGAAKKKGILVNVADTPELCDFYLGGVVTKGTVKVAISTNGKSPTLAKRLRQFFEEILPEEIEELALNLNAYRNKLKGNFTEKVKEMNKVTKELIE